MTKPTAPKKPTVTKNEQALMMAKAVAYDTIKVYERIANELTRANNTVAKLQQIVNQEKAQKEAKEKADDKSKRT